MARKASSNTAESSATVEFEAKLWLASDKIEKDIDSSKRHSDRYPSRVQQRHPKRFLTAFHLSSIIILQPG